MRNLAQGKEISKLNWILSDKSVLEDFTLLALKDINKCANTYAYIISLLCTKIFINLKSVATLFIEFCTLCEFLLWFALQSIIETFYCLVIDRLLPLQTSSHTQQMVAALMK